MASGHSKFFHYSFTFLPMTSINTPYTVDNIVCENDFLRQNLDTFMDYPSRKRRVVLTSSVAESPHRGQILSAVKAFYGFNPDNDPYNEHDFGKVVIAGEEYFFKIDYYDYWCTGGVDPYQVRPNRLMTIMHSSDW